MRRPTRWILLATALTLGSCHGGSEMGVVEVDLYDRPVDCDAETQSCHAAGEDEGADEESPAVDPEPHRSWVFFSDQTTTHHPNGAYLYFEMVRDDGVRAYVEIDVPTTEGETDGAVMRYTERRGDEVVFEADSAHGRVEFAEDLRGDACPCVDGRLELVFVDEGEDGELDTDDDRVRRLSRTRFTWDEEFCIASQMLGMRDDRVDVSVRVVDRCGDATPRPRYDSSEGGGDSSSTYHADTSGCSGDGYDSGRTGGSSSSSSGCEGDSSSGGGCEGDTSSSSGGCEGDTSGGSSGCSGDTGGSSGGCSGDTGGSSCSTTTIVPRSGACPRGGPAGAAAALASSRVQLVLGILLAIVWLDRRRRRRRA